MYRLSPASPVPVRRIALTLPPPQQLAALGPVLCVHRGAVLDGWRAATGATHGVCVDADGVCEYLLLHDAAGRVCWRLYLLPDSDFLAWERLALTVADAARTDVECSGSLHTRLWRRLADNVTGAPWHASVLRLVVRHVGALSVPVLAAHPAGVSAAGLAMAQRVACRTGARRGFSPIDAAPCPAPSVAGLRNRLHTLST